VDRPFLPIQRHWVIVNDLAFLQIDVEGVLIPSSEIVQAVLNQMNLKESSISAFAQHSNAIVRTLEQFIYSRLMALHGNIDKQRQLDLYSEQFLLLKEIADATNFKFDLYQQKWIMMSWFQSVPGNHGGVSSSVVRKELAKMIERNPLDDSRHPVRKSIEDGYPELEIYPEYVEARDINIQFTRNHMDLAKTDPAMERMVRRHIDISRELATVTEKMRKGKGEIKLYFFCRFCGEAKLLPAGKKRSHCGAKKCKAADSTSRNEPTYKRRDWIEDPLVRPKLCVGCESRRRKLNSGRYCRSCWDKTPF
jgi:hypothetical protein